jgi:hypothetical protein
VAVHKVIGKIKESHKLRERRGCGQYCRLYFARQRGRG